MHIVYANGYYYDGDVDIFGRKHGYGIAVSDDGERQAILYDEVCGLEIIM